MKSKRVLKGLPRNVGDMAPPKEGKEGVLRSRGEVDVLDEDDAVLPTAADRFVKERATENAARKRAN